VTAEFDSFQAPTHRPDSSAVRHAAEAATKAVHKHEARVEGLNIQLTILLYGSRLMRRPQPSEGLWKRYHTMVL
jgi:hypothetical protein